MLDRICLGGLPEIYARVSWPDAGAWFDAYIDTIVQRDLRDIANVERLSDLPACSACWRREPASS